MKTLSIIIFTVLFSFCYVPPSLSQPMQFDIIVDLTPAIPQNENKKFAGISYIEYDIVYPGEMFLGLDRIAGTSDDVLYDPDGFDAGPCSFKWEFTLMYASSNIALNFQSGHRYYGIGYYDGGGISEWRVPGLLTFFSVEAGYGEVNLGREMFFGSYGESSSIITHFSITPYCTPVPEPGTLTLMCAAIGGLIGIKIRRKIFITSI